MKKKQEESSLEKLSTWYQDGEQDGGDRSEKRRMSLKASDFESSSRSGGSKSKEDNKSVVDVEHQDRDSKRERDGRERTHGSSSDSSKRKRWDEAGGLVNDGDHKSSKLSDSRHDSGGERVSVSNEHGESRRDLKSDRSLKTSSRDEKSKSRGVKDDDRGSPLKKTSGKDGSEVVREVGRSNRSKTPDADYEKEKYSRKDERSRGRDDGWSDRDRDQEGLKDNWKRRHSSSGDKDQKDGDLLYDRGREREFPRQGRERSEGERSHGRLGGRKDGNRGEAVKALSSGGVSNENYDVIEIQTKPHDYVRGESGPNFARMTESGQQPPKKSSNNEEEWAHNQEGRQRSETFGFGSYGEDSRDEAGEASSDYSGAKPRNQRGSTPGRTNFVQTPNRGYQTPQGSRGNRPLRGGKGRPAGGRENQQGAIPMPIMGSPFANLGMPPPSPIHSLTPGMSPIPGTSVTPVFMPPFAPTLIWPGARGVDGNMLPVPPVLSPLPPGPSGPRFPSIGTPPNPNMFFTPPGSDRGGPPNFPGSNISGQMGRGMPSDKTSGGWVPPRGGGPPGKAPSRGEQNDYSQNFVDTGMRPQNFIRELELTNVEDYPKLRELIQKKDEIVSNSASAPMYLKGDLHEVELSPELFGTKFDVILVDPPWEEYVHRAPGVSDSMEYWTFEDIINLKIEAIADTPSFLFLWVGDGVGLEQGRQCLKKWGFRRCEDICWVKTNKSNAAPTLRHDSRTVFQRSKEHCLMGIKGTVRRSTDGHIIHANIDTDVIIAEEPPYGSTQKPEDMYRIIEHFALGRRRLELFGEDHNIRAGWLTVGKGLSSSNFESQAYVRNFADKEGKVWLGGGGRNPPPDAPHLVVTTPDIESLRPKSPMKNQQQQSYPSSLASANSSNRRTTGNSPQANPNVVVLHQEASGSNFSVPTTPHWVPPTAPAAAGPPPMDSFRVPEGGNNTRPPDDKSFDMYGFN
ncbi:S-adenosyl-L-methionine-dependent methyltransferase [Arabidopsis suecica]|uniref:S-adenosyl-L-methionine-dependent methyltransferase n=1 Tax=Arabidopsis suecica TaxID=45249 RepID=A0A8T2EK86_ARASU|nr:S-adenosyl-L-methionine-dependent methyltransferase [Arabidopsis suecica]